MLGTVSDTSGRHGFAARTPTGPVHDRSHGLPHVQAWLVASDRGDAQASANALTATEIARSGRLKRASDRAAFTVTRAALRHILARELAIEPRTIRLVEPELGKPRLCASHGRPEIDFSVSHTDGLSIIALSHHVLVGADIERCRAVPEKLKIATEMFGEDAAPAIAALSPSEQDGAFLRLWTAGEAYVKATGTGLAFRRQRIPIRIESDGRSVALRQDFVGRDAWQLAHIDAPAGYVCCLATFDRDRMPSTTR